MFYDMWPRTFCPKELLKVLDMARKKCLQFNSNLSIYVLSKHVLLGKKYVARETYVTMRTTLKVFGQTLHVTKPTTHVWQYLNPKKVNFKKYKNTITIFWKSKKIKLNTKFKQTLKLYNRLNLFICWHDYTTLVKHS